MTEDRRTKAQLVAELARVQSEADSLRSRIPAAPPRVPEADALAGCIRALDAIKERAGYGYNSDSSSAVRRTIIALCEKYGIPRFEKVPEPCTRRHVEDMNAGDVMNAVRREFEGIYP